MNEMLGDQCHLITMKGWRHGPGHGTTPFVSPLFIMLLLSSFYPLWGESSPGHFGVCLS